MNTGQFKNRAWWAIFLIAAGIITWYVSLVGSLDLVPDPLFTTLYSVLFGVLILSTCGHVLAARRARSEDERLVLLQYGTVVGLSACYLARSPGPFVSIQSSLWDYVAYATAFLVLWVACKRQTRLLQQFHRAHSESTCGSQGR